MEAKTKRGEGEIFKYVKKVFPYFKRYKKHVIIIIFTFLFASIASAFIPAIIGHAISELTELDFTKTIFFIFLLLIISIIVAIINKLGVVSYVKMQKGITNELKIDISTAMLDLEISDLNKKSSGMFIDRIKIDYSTSNDINITFKYETFDEYGNPISDSKTLSFLKEFNTLTQLISEDVDSIEFTISDEQYNDIKITSFDVINEFCFNIYRFIYPMSNC